MTRKSGFWVLLATILGSSMVFIDSSVVNVALPTLQNDLNATATSIQWVVEAYALFLAALMLVGGSLGDLYGRKRIFILGIIIFALSSAWCGIAPTIGQLILARAVQGVGGALLTPGSLAIIRSAFDDERRGQAIGLWSGFTAITSAFGPVLGGWLTQNASWRWIFYLNVPLAIVVILVSLRHLPESRAHIEFPHLDWRGALLATLGLGGIVYGLIESNNLGLTHPLVISSIVVGLLALIAFCLVELRSPAPMMPLYLFRSSTFSGTNLLTLFLYAALGGSLFFLPFNLVRVQGYSSTAAGASLLPFTLLMFLLSRWSGGLVKRYGSRRPLIIGPTLAGLGFTLMAVPGIGGSYWTTFFPAILVLSLGMAITVAPLTTTVLAAVDEDHAGIASGINNAVSRVANLLAVAVLGIFLLQTFSLQFSNRLDSLQLSPQVRTAMEQQRDRSVDAKIPNSVDSTTQAQIKQAIDASFVAGFRLIMLIAAGLAFIGALCVFFMVKDSKTVSVEKQGGERDDARHELREA